MCIYDRFGVLRKQLVKSGNDDMRQDDVIRQFFNLMNGLLQHSRATAERGLGLRTYKVGWCCTWPGAAAQGGGGAHGLGLLPNSRATAEHGLGLRTYKVGW